MQVMRITGNVFNLLVMVNCAANFILYSALSTNFRATFSHLFCACRNSSPDAPPPAGRRCCRCWPVRTYRPAAGRDANPDVSVSTVYASLPAGGRAAAARAGRAGGRLTIITEDYSDDDDEDNVKDEDDGRCSMTHTTTTTTTTDKLMMSSQSAVEEDPDELHVTQL